MLSSSTADTKGESNEGYESRSDRRPGEGKHGRSEICRDVELGDSIIDRISVDEKHDLGDKRGCSNKQESQEGYNCRDYRANSGAQCCQSDENGNGQEDHRDHIQCEHPATCCAHFTKIVLDGLRNSDRLSLKQLVLEDLNWVECIHRRGFRASRNVGIILAIALAISPERVLIEVVKTKRLSDGVELASRRNRIRNNVRRVDLILAPINREDKPA
jgi:hypothetical protein